MRGVAGGGGEADAASAGDARETALQGRGRAGAAVAPLIGAGLRDFSATPSFPTRFVPVSWCSSWAGSAASASKSPL